MRNFAVWTAEQLLYLADTEPRRLVPIVLDLQSRLTLNSTNSSKPPSSDGLHKPAPKSLRQPTGRKPGGQQGHPGSTLRPVDKPDQIIPIPLDICPRGCGTSLKKRPVSAYVTRQVFDLPPQKLFVTEHRAETKRCPACDALVTAPFPSHVSAPVQYGTRFLALLVYLRDQQFIASDRLSQLCADIFGQGVSEQIIQNAETTAYQNLQGFETQVMTLLPSAKILHADETGLRVLAKLQWVHTLGSRLLTWYGLHARRGRQAMKYFSVLTRFHGRLIHDCLAAYFQWPCLHGLCNAHLLRELTFLFETLRQDWAGKMKRLLLDMHKRVDDLKTQGRSRLSRTEILSWLRRYNALLDQGRAANPPPTRSTAPRRGRPKKSKALNLLDRLHRHKKSALAFLRDFRVPFTNNHAEQILRMLKVRQKISGGFRTATGAERFLRLRSYIDTVRKHNLPVFQALADAIAGHPFIPLSTD